MSDSPWSPKAFFAELARRRVLRVAIVYAVIAAPVMDLADVIVAALGLPPSLVRVIVVLSLMGFPVALVLAWAFDITRGGVVRTESIDTSGDALVDAEARGRARASGRLAVAAVSVVFLLSAGLSWRLLRPGESLEASAPTSRYRDSVAVMPLDNLTGDPANDYLGAAITEEIIAHLAQISPLKVISRHSVEALAESGLRAPELADSLGVRHIVEGSFQIDRGMLRATLQHIDGETDAHLWAESFPADLNDAIGAQETIARAVFSRVLEVLDISGPVAEAAAGHSTPSAGLEAYQLGKHWLGRRTPEGLNRAIQQFELAIEADSGFAAAHADLSSSYALALVYRYATPVAPYEMVRRSVVAAERAITLDGGLASGYAARGYVGAILGSDQSSVASDFERAAVLAPNAASVPSWSARILAQQGQPEEALAEAERAVDLDPLASGRHIAVASAALQLGRYERAIAAARRAVALEPELVWGNALEARALLLSGNAQACADAELGPHGVLKATCLHELGRLDEAGVIIDSVQAEIDAGQLDVSTFTAVLRFEDLAVHNAWIGDGDQSLTWIRRAFDESPTGLENRLYQSALFDKVRGTSSFTDGVAQVRAARLERVRGSGD